MINENSRIGCTATPLGDTKEAQRALTNIQYGAIQKVIKLFETCDTNDPKSEFKNEFYSILETLDPEDQTEVMNWLRPIINDALLVIKGVN